MIQGHFRRTHLWMCFTFWHIFLPYRPNQLLGNLLVWRKYILTEISPKAKWKTYKIVKRFRFYYVLLLNIWTLKYATSIRAVILYAIIIHYTTIVLYFSHWISQRFAITSCWKVINLHQNIIICWWHVVEYLMQKSGSVS